MQLFIGFSNHIIGSKRLDKLNPLFFPHQRKKINVKSAREQIIHSLFHDHNNLRAPVKSSQALHKFWMMQLIHQFNFLSGRCLLSGSTSFVELPSTYPASLFVYKPEHLSKLPTKEQLIEDVKSYNWLLL